MGLFSYLFKDQKREMCSSGDPGKIQGGASLEREMGREQKLQRNQQPGNASFRKQPKTPSMIPEREELKQEGRRAYKGCCDPESQQFM